MKILLIFAHPDDETFALGGTIKILSKKNSVNLICATRGEVGLLGNPPAATKENLAEVRTKELQSAAKILGIKKIYFLDLIDGTLHLKNKGLYSKILKIISIEKPDKVITFDKTGASNHPDHKAVSISATKAFKSYLEKTKRPTKLYHTAIPESVIKKMYGKKHEYKAYGRIAGTADELITTKIDISKTLNVKIKALKMHKTQNKDVDNFLKRGKDLNYEYLKLIEENQI